MLCCLLRPTATLAADTPATPAIAKSEIEREPIRRTTSAASTAPTTQRAGVKPAAPGTGGFDVRRMVLALGAVVALIFLLKFGLKRVFGVANAPRSSRAVQVLTRSPLSPRHQLMVLRVGRRLIVVADGGGQMSTLSEITDPDEVAALLGQLPDDHGGAAAKFGSVFGKMRRPYEADEDGEGGTETPPLSAVDPFDPGAAAEGDGHRSERNDPAVSTTRQEVLGLMDKVRMLSRQFKS
jgi:flagellar biogenesis protein FliO